MNEVYIVRRGGGVKLFAAIGVTYPEGSTLTCTNGTKTLKAKTTTGQWVFAIPEAGTWTVTATDGTETDSQAVSITTEGQFSSVELSYSIVIFDNGTVGVPISLGYKNYSSNSVTIGDVITVNAAKNSTTAPSHASVVTDEKIDISDYSTLYVSTTARTVTDNTYGDVWLLVGDNRTASVYNYGNAPTGWATSADVANVGVTSLDISSLTGEYYIGLGCAYAATASFDKWWLE